MNASYRKTFDKIHASGKLRENVRNMVKQERKPRKRIGRLVLAAALTAALAGAVAADNGDMREPLRDDLPRIGPISLEEELGRSWEQGGGVLDDAQKQVIARAVQPAGVSGSCDGVTVSADSVYATELYLELLVRIRGENLSNLYHGDLRTYELTGTVQGHSDAEVRSISCTAGDLGIQEDGTLVRHLTFGFSPQGPSLLNGAELELRLRNLKTFGGGEWVLPIHLDPAEGPEALTLDQAEVSVCAADISGHRENVPIVLQDIQVTAAGFRFRTTWGSPGKVCLLLTDGTAIEHGEMSEKGRTDGPKEVEGRWPAPADFSKIAALQVGDAVIPLR